MLIGSRPSTDEYFLRMAELTALRGTCARRQVGCVLVDANNHVLATGYNGVARGLPHCNEMVVDPFDMEGGLIHLNYCPGRGQRSGEGLHLCQAIHAEANALVQCHDVSRIHSVYCTASPCVHCMRLILGTGAKRIVFRQEYPHGESEALATGRGLEWICIR
jgi:dCMP deaminase